MKKLLILTIISLILGCKKQEVAIPPDILKEAEMVDILIDVHLLEAKVRRLYLDKDSSKQVFAHFENLLFQDKGITHDDYARSMDFYLEEMDLFRSVYDQVLDSLLERQKSNRID